MAIFLSIGSVQKNLLIANFLKNITFCGDFLRITHANLVHASLFRNIILYLIFI